MNAATPNELTPQQTLVQYFERNGCLRRPNPDRRKTETRSYKMGYEIRFVAHTKRELAELRRAIRGAGLKPGKPFAKVNRWVQPVYGRDAMERFVAWFQSFGDKDRLADAGRPIPCSTQSGG